MYKDIWEAIIGENLLYWKELNNRRDPFVVAVPGYQTIVGVIVHGRNTTGK